jgi:hypothetical protein
MPIITPSRYNHDKMENKLLTPTTLIVFCIIGCIVASCVEEEYIAYSPEITSPAFGASAQSLEAVLEWDDTDPAGGIYEFGNGDQFYTFDVYLGTTQDNLELVASDLLVENFRCSSLAFNTTYFWKIVAREATNGETKQSPVGKFSTAGELQKIKVGENTIMVYPGDYMHPDPSSLMGYLFTYPSEAVSWEDGELNTKAILDYYGGHTSRGWGAAAEHCDQLIAYGYSDWYLPAILEIDAVVTENNLAKYEKDEYWSSTEYPEYHTRAMTKSTLYNPLTGYDDEDKFADLRCRCVRKD